MAREHSVWVQHHGHVITLKGGEIGSAATRFFKTCGYSYRSIPERGVDNDCFAYELDPKHDEFAIEVARFELEMYLDALGFEVNPDTNNYYQRANIFAPTLRSRL